MNQLPQIKHRWTGAVLFTGEFGMTTRQMLEKATTAKVNLSGADLSDANLRVADLRGAYLRGADLSDANLRDADLRGADLSDANLRDADLRGADLRGADLRDANLSGAYLRGADGKTLRATDAESIEALDKVRAIILDDQARLEMGHWHGGTDWVNRTCAEEAVCGTTHCLAGWLQVCSINPDIRNLGAELAGILSAPIAAKMFYKTSGDVLSWLESRAYAQELASKDHT